jgi:hypothetical protein
MYLGTVSGNSEGTNTQVYTWDFFHSVSDDKKGSIQYTGSKGFEPA